MMMWIEGEGKRPPVPVRIRMSGGDMRVLLLEAQKRARHRGYESKATTWENGICDSIEIDGVGRLTKAVRPIFAGLIGECGVSRAVGGSIDFLLLDGGDDGRDLVIHGLGIQVKLCQKSCGANLVRCRNERGYSKPITARVHVFCEWDKSDVRTVGVRGWVWSKDMVALPEVKSAVGSWWNFDVPNEMLLPVSQLKDELEARRIDRGNH